MKQKINTQIIIVTMSLYTVLAFQLIAMRLNDIKTSLNFVPKIIKNNNLMMYKSIIVENAIFFVFCLFIGSILLFMFLYSISRFKDSVKKIYTILIIVIYLFSLCIFQYSENKSIYNDLFDSNEIKAEYFVNDIVNKNYSNASSSYSNSPYLNSFISSSLYRRATKRSRSSREQVTEIKPVNTYKIDKYLIITYLVIYNDTNTSYYNIAFNNKNELSGFYITESLQFE